jgi:peptidyl-prolyl cis-trans isomerase D
MTMLDRMRRHKGWLKWSLALVCVTFVMFYIPAFLQDRSGTSADVVASVDGREISVNEFRRTYQAQLEALRGSYGGNINSQLLKQLGMDQQILQQMVDEQAAIAAAQRAGIRVTDAEVAQRIYSFPAFQYNGQFVGQAQYQRILQMQRPPLSPSEFEDRLRRDLTVEKLRSAVTDWLTVSNAEAEKEYRLRNDKVKLEVANFPIDKFRNEVTVSDADIASYFEAHKDAYRIGERRKARYLLVDVDAIRPTVVVPARDLERYYNENIETYSTPEQIRASYILFKTAGKDEAEVKAKAEKVLKEAKAGADFAELARKYSDDQATAKQGGDLDYISQGRMAPEFDQVAFSMEPGQISDLVKTPDGFDIIKLVDKKPAATRPFDEVKPQILEQLQYQQAQTKAADEAEAIEKEVKTPADLEKVAAQRGLKVQETGFFTREEPIMGLGASPEAMGQIFDLKEGQVTGAVPVARGYAFLAVTAIQPPHLPKLDEVKDKVREDVVRQKARELARQKAASLAASVKSAADFAKAAKAAGVEVKTTELIPRESPIPDIGVSPQVDQVAFSLPAGVFSGPIVTDNSVAVIHVVEKKEPTAAEAAADLDRTRQDLLAERRNRFFTAYMVKAKQGMKITVNRQAVQRVIG